MRKLRYGDVQLAVNITTNERQKQPLYPELQTLKFMSISLTVRFRKMVTECGQHWMQLTLNAGNVGKVERCY